MNPRNTKKSPIDDDHALVVRDPSILALGDCEEIQDAAIWVLRVLEKLEELSRLPLMESGVGGISKQRRLQLALRGLFGFLAMPREIDPSKPLLGDDLDEVPEETEVTFHDGFPYRALALTETEEHVHIGPITAPSASHATIFLARGFLAALNRLPTSKPLGPIRRVRKIDLTSMKPRAKARTWESVIDWIGDELTPRMLDGVYDSVLGEMHAARRYLKDEGDTPNRKTSHHSEAVRAILDKNGNLGTYARLVLVALHVWEKRTPDWEVTRSALKDEVMDLQERIGMNRGCSIATVAKQYRGLRILGHIHQPPQHSARLSCYGRKWVRKSDIYKQHKASK